MSGPINRVPVGFLELLRAKVGGATPKKFENDVQPVMEMAGMYDAGLLRGQTATSSGTSGSVNIAVTQGESWVIHTIFGSIDNNSTATDVSAYGQIRLTNLQDGANPVFVDVPLVGVELRNNQTTSEKDYGSSTWIPSGRFILPTGRNIQMKLETASAAVNFDLGVLYSVLKG